MATSDTAIANLALQKLAQGRITDLDQDVPAAIEIKTCFEHCRDLELATHNWRFAIKRMLLSPDATAPAFGKNYAFLLPADLLKPILEDRQGSDWEIENHNGNVAILTNYNDPIRLRYVSRVSDVTRFPPYFDEMLSCRIAAQTCEVLTNSNSKQEAVMKWYTDAMRTAKKTNAFITVPVEPPVDDWDYARIAGSRGLIWPQGS